MEAPEEVVEFAARTNERTSLPKRKRTKRQRGQSPFAFSIAGTPSEEKVGKVGPLSPANSSEVTRGDEINEEEDMAHCLILLARGRLSGGHERRQLSAEEDDEANDDRRHDKFNSKRFLETGEYVFQCRTCDKVFPSFQALGGHRASHKKSKITTAPAMADDNKRQILSTSSPDDVTDDEDSLSLQLMNTRNSCPNKPSHNNNGKHITKVHECSICGAEFSSGQALGGHMRRHRPLMTGQTQPPLALTPKTPESEEPSRPRNNIKVPSLQLDLNLPAPEDDDPAEAGPFPLNSSGKERRDRSNQLVLSFPALVGCHY